MRYLFIIGLLTLLGCSKVDHKYNSGDCIWHINGDGGKNIFKVVDVWRSDDRYYITKIMDYQYIYGVTAFHMMSIDYVDTYHYSVPHADKCRKGLIPSAQEECLKDPNYEFTTGHMVCPFNKEEYLKFKKKWSKEKK